MSHGIDFGNLKYLAAIKKSSEIDPEKKISKKGDQKLSQSRNEKIKEIAVQFETMFLETLLKQVFKDSENQSGFQMGKNTLTDFRLMLFSQHISENGGLGYQDMIEQQIREKYFGGDNGDSGAGNSIITKRSGMDRRFLSLGKSIFSGDKRPSITALGKMGAPVEGEISSDYGWRDDPFSGKKAWHNGIDFAVPLNTPVKSVWDGKVTFAGWKSGYGNLVEIEHRNGVTSRYGHIGSLLVKAGDKVKKGEVISKSGSTGRSTGPHLHFELLKDGTAVDPKKNLP